MKDMADYRNNIFPQDYEWRMAAFSEDGTRKPLLAYGPVKDLFLGIMNTYDAKESG